MHFAASWLAGKAGMGPGSPAANSAGTRLGGQHCEPNFCQLALQQLPLLAQCRPQPATESFLLFQPICHRPLRNSQHQRGQA